MSSQSTFTDTVYLGPVGSRLTFTATVVSIHGDYGPFGMKWKVVMRTDTDQLLVWLSSSQTAGLANRGTVLRLVGTVKEHKVNSKGHGVTVVTNCKPRN